MDNIRAPQTVAKDQTKLIGLEALRFLAAAGVLIYHYKYFFAFKDTLINYKLEQLPFYAFLFVFIKYGAYGVQIFWGISGFIFFWKYRKSVGSREVTPKKFFTNRFSRLYPLHFVTLQVMLVLETIYFIGHKFFFVYPNNNLKDYILQLFLASHWGLEDGYSFNGPIWSVSVEILVYFIFFLILRLFGKSSVVNVFCFLGFVVLKVLGVTTSLVDCLTMFYAGGASAMLFERLQGNLSRRSFRLINLAIIIFSVVVSWFFYHRFHDNAAKKIVVIVTPFILFMLAGLRFRSGAVNKTLAILGNLTYASYLIHIPIILSTVMIFEYAHLHTAAYNPFFFLAFLSVVFTLSYFVFYRFEKPMQDFIRTRWR